MLLVVQAGRRNDQTPNAAPNRFHQIRCKLRTETIPGETEHPEKTDKIECRQTIEHNVPELFSCLNKEFLPSLKNNCTSYAQISPESHSISPCRERKLLDCRQMTQMSLKIKKVKKNLKSQFPILNSIHDVGTRNCTFPGPSSSRRLTNAAVVAKKSVSPQTPTLKTDPLFFFFQASVVLQLLRC